MDSRTFELRFLGDPILELECDEVIVPSQIPDGMVPSMKEIMRVRRGVGLSAPQVGVPIAVALIQVNGEIVVAVNPRVEKKSEEMNTSEEGCLSIPNFFIPKARPNVATISFQDPALEERHTMIIRGFEARIALHEIDHLAGKIIVTGAGRHFRRQAERCVEKAMKGKQRIGSR